MDAPIKTFSELVSILKSWIPWRSEPANVSRDFWMPDHSCRVCYECDSQFTLFNRRHHCRLCGRVFCGKCTENSVPAPVSEGRNTWEECEKIRVCNYCFKQWKQEIANVGNEIGANLDHSISPSTSSLLSTKSSGTIDSSNVTLCTKPFSAESYQPLQQGSSSRALQSSRTVKIADMESPNQFTFSINRSDDDEEEYFVCRSDSEIRQFSEVNGYYGQVEFDKISNGDGSHIASHDGESISAEGFSFSFTNHNFDSQELRGLSNLGEKHEPDIGDEGEAPRSSFYVSEDVDAEAVDFENNGLLWVPPEPEDEEDERETVLCDDDDDAGDDANAFGEWGYLRTSRSFGSGEYRNRDKSIEEHKKAMKNVVDGHFRALVAQLLQVESLPVGEEDDKHSWLEIITSLSWEAATLLKPDMSKGGGMDPGGYVKVKCIASGHRCESVVVKGVVCKKNVAHRRMTAKIDKPRLLILGGALEYQRVSNHLSSFDTLLQQEMDHLKMAVAKIAAHRPNVLLVEKSVSRFAQEYLLAKDISLVLNIKKTLLERIARCTGAQIVPSIDHLSSQKLGYCENFHVERFLENLGSAGQGGKKSVKTLMFFQSCPKPLGCTILLRGANGDELKKVKHVVQYGVFAAYHLALETSFLADEGASLPELPLNNPITVALPGKSSSIERSISIVPGFRVTGNEKPEGFQTSIVSQRPENITNADVPSSFGSAESGLPDGISLTMQSTWDFINSTAFFSSTASGNVSGSCSEKLSSFHPNNEPSSEKSLVAESTAVKNSLDFKENNVKISALETSEHFKHDGFENDHKNILNQVDNLVVSTLQENNEIKFEQGSLNEEELHAKEDFPPSPSDHQSILVSLSSRCVWKGTVCERSHLFRIKYYCSFDKPLGRFLRDHLFDQSYRCNSCEMPSEAHVHCYTHRQGTLTISVKKLPEILLPGEREGKIWMWHRCLRCRRTNGFPPATRRIIMSDAAWGLSFGKFLELSFSNHAAASRVASCGHSLHRDCLRFYGFGKMVACFRYASIDVHSVYLPPSKLEFNHENQEWIQKQTDEIVDRAELLFSEVLNALRQIEEKRSTLAPISSGTKKPELRRQVAELEGVLQKEKAEFKEALQKTLNKEVKKGQPVIDILEMNRLQRQLLFQSYMWDHRLIYAASLDKNGYQDGLCSFSENLVNASSASTPGRAFSSSESFLVDAKLDHLGMGNDACQQDIDTVQENSHSKEEWASLSSIRSIGDLSDPLEESGLTIRRALSDGQVPIIANLSDTLDAKWRGENHLGFVIPKNDGCAVDDAFHSSTINSLGENVDVDNHSEDQNGPKTLVSVSPASFTKSPGYIEDSLSWFRMPFLNFYRSFNKNFLASAQKLDTLVDYNPVYVSSFREQELQGGARLLLPIGVSDTVIPVYDDEPSSIISYALMSPEYHMQLSDEGDMTKDDINVLSHFSDSINFPSFHSADDASFDSHRNIGLTDDMISSITGSRNALMSDPLAYTKALHVRVSFGDDGPLGKVKYSVTCYYAKWFEALRRVCCPDLDYIRSLSRCKKWGAQGGKSNVFFAKTLDDRFIIKQVTKTELESFIKFAPEYFKYLSESIGTRSPTCLAKILGIYQVTSKHLKGGKESRMDVLVMENLLFRRTVTRLYDLKGSSRSRYNPDSSGSNKVLLDQNLIESMPTSPIFVGNKAKRLLERAVWNDTAFLASVDVMDYSLLVGVDEEKHELVLGIIDFMRQYTWDKHLETWVKASGILGGPKNASPTVISPKQYKKRFRKAMTTYFLMVPDQWSPPSLVPSKSQSDLVEENTPLATSVE